MLKTISGFNWVIEPDTNFIRLWRAIIQNDQLKVDNNKWVLNCCSGACWSESTQLLVIRDWWKKLHSKILGYSDSSGDSLELHVVSTENKSHACGGEAEDKVSVEASPVLVLPLMVILDGKAGRGKSAFLRYLIFSILIKAKQLKAEQFNNRSSSAYEQHQIDPCIAYIDPDNKAYLITITKISKMASQEQLMAGKPHYFFADGVDIEDDSYASRVVMGLTSGGTNGLLKYRKRCSEARDKLRSHLFMSSPDLHEMKAMFAHISSDDSITFRFDVVGGNPRVAFAQPSADSSCSHFKPIKEVVDTVFPISAKPATMNTYTWKDLRQWAVGIVSDAVECARKNRSNSTIDSSVFREYVVGDDCESHREVFSSVFMGIVATRLMQLGDVQVDDTLKRRLFGSAAGMDVHGDDEVHEDNGAKKRKRQMHDNKGGQSLSKNVRSFDIVAVDGYRS